MSGLRPLLAAAMADGGSGAEPSYTLLILATVFAVIGIVLMVPPTAPRRRAIGALVAAAGLAMFGAHMPLLGDWIGQVIFWLIAGVAVVSAAATISMQSPVYSAIWFAITLLATAGLFVLQQAPFLGVATIIVYAGAILVTFLFVLMLAQPEGHAYYDRISWGPLVPLGGALCGGFMMCAVGYAAAVFAGQQQDLLRLTEESAIHIDHVDTDSDSMVDLGREMFSRHLLSVELAGTLLLVALVGAIAIVIQTQANRGPVHHE